MNTLFELAEYVKKKIDYNKDCEPSQRTDTVTFNVYGLADALGISDDDKEMPYEERKKEYHARFKEHLPLQRLMGRIRDAVLDDKMTVEEKEKWLKQINESLEQLYVEHLFAISVYGRAYRTFTAMRNKMESIIKECQPWEAGELIYKGE